MAARLPGAFGRALVLCALLVFAACAPSVPPEPDPELRPLPVASIDGWRADRPGPALAAFQRSCRAIRGRQASEPMGATDAFGRVADWLPACEEALRLDPADDDAAKDFFTRRFRPYALADRGEASGLFTGYYEPLLHGSRAEGGPYQVPLYRAPDDLLLIDLAAFDPALEGRQVVGRVKGDRVVPYHSRTAIEGGALDGRGLELIWVDDPIDKFFLQIQGSGRVRMDDGSQLRIGYAGRNGHAYRAIGRDLVEAGELTREAVSMQAIRRWLEDHPDQATALMQKNQSYIFFRELTGLGDDAGPLGAQGVPLTPGRSLAVDRRYVALGTPVWLDTDIPERAGDTPFRRLMVAQDVGGAIKGVVRGDVFFGAGEEAAEVAGRMKHQGSMILFLPVELSPTATLPAGASLG